MFFKYLNLFWFKISIKVILFLIFLSTKIKENKKIKIEVELGLGFSLVKKQWGKKKSKWRQWRRRRWEGSYKKIN